MRRFLDQALHPVDLARPAKPDIRISARNQLHGTITSVHNGEVMSTIKAVLSDGQPLTAAITKDAADDSTSLPATRSCDREVDRGHGGESLNVHNAIGDIMRLSARNQLHATVDSVSLGGVMASVKVTLPDGQQITATITKDAAEELAFAPGDAVTVVIKSTEVMLAKD